MGSKITVLGVSILFYTSSWAVAADLKPETVAAWNEYVKDINTRNQKPVVPGGSFLSIDRVPGEAARLRAGEIIVAPAGPQVPLIVPQGLIHDWVGAAFVPNATLDDVLRVLRDYERYKDFYHPYVNGSALIAKGPSEDRFSLLLINKAVISKVALDSTFRSFFTGVDDQRSYVISEATRIQEVAGYGTPSQHLLPENEGLGLIWRLYSATRLEERDGGVYIDVEVAALSRDVPASLRWLVTPIVRRVSRSSLAISLRQTQEAVRFGATSGIGVSNTAVCPVQVSCGSILASPKTANAFR